jgi:hypothetical protein
MKVRLNLDIFYVDKGDDSSIPIEFFQGNIYEVVHTFDGGKTFGLDDNTVYVLLNNKGEAMSVSKEMCTEVDDES